MNPRMFKTYSLHYPGGTCKFWPSSSFLFPFLRLLHWQDRVSALWFFVFFPSCLLAYFVTVSFFFTDRTHFACTLFPTCSTHFAFEFFHHFFHSLFCGIMFTEFLFYLRSIWLLVHKFNELIQWFCCVRRLQGAYLSKPSMHLGVTSQNANR